MSKKKFTEGLESLFGSTSEEEIQEELVLFPEAKKKPREKKKSSSGKDFTSDLQSFLTEAFEDSFEEQLTEKKKSDPSLETRIKKRRRKPLSGLDSLIRSTVEPKDLEIDDDKPTKRVTLLIDKSKLEKLKKIARLERSYLRQIIDEIVKEYIEGYEKEKGKVE